LRRRSASYQLAGSHLLALRNVIAYGREADQSLILAAGLAHEWHEGAGVKVDRMPTIYDSLSYSLRSMDANTLRFEIGGGIMGKMVLRPPLAAPRHRVMVDGKPRTSFDGDSVTILQTPASVTCTTEK